MPGAATRPDNAAAATTIAGRSTSFPSRSFFLSNSTAFSDMAPGPRRDTTRRPFLFVTRPLGRGDEQRRRPRRSVGCSSRFPAAPTRPSSSGWLPNRGERHRLAASPHCARRGRLPACRAFARGRRGPRGTVALAGAAPTTRCLPAAAASALCAAARRGGPRRARVFSQRHRAVFRLTRYAREAPSRSSHRRRRGVCSETPLYGEGVRRVPTPPRSSRSGSVPACRERRARSPIGALVLRRLARALCPVLPRRRDLHKALWASRGSRRCLAPSSSATCSARCRSAPPRSDTFRRPARASLLLPHFAAQLMRGGLDPPSLRILLAHECSPTGLTGLVPVRARHATVRARTPKGARTSARRRRRRRRPQAPALFGPNAPANAPTSPPARRLFAAREGVQPRRGRCRPTADSCRRVPRRVPRRLPTCCACSATSDAAYPRWRPRASSRSSPSTLRRPRRADAQVRRVLRRQRRASRTRRSTPSSRPPSRRSSFGCSTTTRGRPPAAGALGNLARNADSLGGVVTPHRRAGRPIEFALDYLDVVPTARRRA